MYGISHKFSSPKTPQRNGVVERKNHTLQEMARVMLNSKKLSKRLWAEAMNTACHIIKRVYFRLGSKKTPCKLWKSRKPNISYFHVFGSVCYILNDREHLGKFNSTSDDCVFLGYSMNSKAYCIYNMRTQTIIESINIDDANDFSEFSKAENISSLIEESGDEVGLVQPAETSSKTETGPSDSISTDPSITTKTF